MLKLSHNFGNHLCANFSALAAASGTVVSLSARCLKIDRVRKHPTTGELAKRWKIEQSVEGDWTWKRERSWGKPQSTEARRALLSEDYRRETGTESYSICTRTRSASEGGERAPRATCSPSRPLLTPPFDEFYKRVVREEEVDPLKEKGRPREHFLLQASWS